MDTNIKEEGCVILKKKEYEKLKNDIKKGFIGIKIYADGYHTYDTNNLILIKHTLPEIEYNKFSTINLSENIMQQIQRILNNIHLIHKTKLEAFIHVINKKRKDEINEIKKMSFWQLYRYWKNLKKE
jgi:hypothetical protein